MIGYLKLEEFDTKFAVLVSHRDRLYKNQQNEI